MAITEAVLVPGGSGWRAIQFSIDPASLTPLLGSSTTALSNTTELRLFHNPAASYPPPPEGPAPVNLVLGVDNIRATQAVPEPSSAVLAGIGLVGLLLRTRAGARGRRSRDREPQS